MSSSIFLSYVRFRFLWINTLSLPIFTLFIVYRQLLATRFWKCHNEVREIGRLKLISMSHGSYVRVLLGSDMFYFAFMLSVITFDIAVSSLFNFRTIILTYVFVFRLVQFMLISYLLNFACSFLYCP